jgi:glutathione S-transferase
MHGKITITALKWVPPFAAGNVRDHRARWVLNEVGWPHEVRLLDGPTLKSKEYRQDQPFGQVPMFEEEGRPAMFESGAMVLDVAMRSNQLLGKGEAERAQVLQWSIAALNSLEPYLANVAECEYFIQDETLKKLRRPGVYEMAKTRLREVENALGDRDWLVGNDFTAADLLMSSVLKIAKGLKLIDTYPKLAAYAERCWSRPAYKKAIESQLAEINRHSPADMKFPNSN